MIWNSPFKFQTKAEKCIHTYVKEALEKFANETPDKKILISAEDTTHFLTSRQILDQIRATETFLDKIEFEQGHIATMYMPNHIELVAIYMAVLSRGGIYAGLSPTYTKYEVLQHMSESGTTVVFTVKSLLPNVLYFSEKAKHKMKIILLDAADDNYLSWTDVVKTKGEPVQRSVDKHDIAVLPFSSGTTGMPKGIRLSHFNIMSNVLNMIKHAEDQIPHPVATNSIWDCFQVLTFPAYHISGKFFILPNILTGATTVMLKTYNCEQYLESIQRFKGWNILVSPSMLLQFIRNPLVDKYDLSSLGYVTCGSAPLGVDVAREFMDKFPNVTLTQNFGMSECMLPFLPFCYEQVNFASVGCVAPGHQAKVIELESGKELGPNETGEIVFRGPGVMRGYLNIPDVTKETLDEEGWLRSGDVGYINGKGEIFIVDRRKEFMKVNGATVAPAEVENAIASDPRIRDVGVVGVPDSRTGEMPHAFVVKNDPELNEEDVKALIRERLSVFKFPEGVVVFVDEIPKLSTGKIHRRQLKAMVS